MRTSTSSWPHFLFLAISLPLAFIACSGSSTGTTGGGGSGAGPLSCRKNVNTDQCECSSSELSLGSNDVKVQSCDSAPSGALICAHYATTTSVDSCYYRVPHCAMVNRNYTTCECGLRDDHATNVASCTAPTCCQFDDDCECTTISGSSLDNTQFAKSCAYDRKGTSVSSCDVTQVTPGCESPLKKVPSCAGLKWL